MPSPIILGMSKVKTREDGGTCDIEFNIIITHDTGTTITFDANGYIQEYTLGGDARYLDPGDPVTELNFSSSSTGTAPISSTYTFFHTTLQCKTTTTLSVAITADDSVNPPTVTTLSRTAWCSCGCLDPV